MDDASLMENMKPLVQTWDNILFQFLKCKLFAFQTTVFIVRQNLNRKTIEAARSINRVTEVMNLLSQCGANIIELQNHRDYKRIVEQEKQLAQLEERQDVVKKQIQNYEEKHKAV